ncbi:MAG: hypothetical protein ABI743_11885 [bacterium]
MTTIALAAVLSLLPASADTLDDLPLSRADFDVTGPVKTVGIQVQDIGTDHTPSKKHELLTFDTAGTLVKIDEFEGDGLVTRRLYTFDPSHVHLSISNQFNRSVDLTRTDMEEIGKDVLRLDDAGHILAMDSFAYGELVHTIARTYDPAGRLLEHAEMSDSGKLLLKKSVQYDDSTDAMDETILGNGSAPVRDETPPERIGHWTCDAQDRPFTCTYRLKDWPGVEYVQTFTYDTAGRVIADHTRCSVGSIEHIDFVYDEHGSLTKRHFVSSKGTWDLDENVYTYDAHGNWLTRRHTRTFKVPDMPPIGPTIDDTKRTITYF